MQNVLATAFFIIICFFALLVSCIYILSSLVFVIPMSKKYKILVDEVSNKNTGRYILISIATLSVFFVFYLLYKTSYLFFIIFVVLFIIEQIVSIRRYKKFNILNYINYYSADMFNWYKVYKLNIDPKIKENCFKIYDIDITYYQRLYEEYKNFELEYITFKAKQNTIKKINENPLNDFFI